MTPTPLPPHLSDEERALWDDLQYVICEARRGWEERDGLSPAACDLMFDAACRMETSLTALLTALSTEREAGERLRRPDIYWLCADPEIGVNNIEDFADMIERGDVERINVAHMLRDQWAAHVRIPETPTSDEDSEIQLFATEAEALAAVAAPSTETPHAEN